SLILLAPTVLISFLGYQDAKRSCTATIINTRESTTFLTATILEERFDRLKDVSVSLATRQRFRQLVADGKWEDAIDILVDIPTYFPYIERVFIADTRGILKADVPEITAVREQDFSDRDWYRGVTERWEPYISEVYKRAAEPQLNVIAVASPIRFEEKVVGILVLQLRVDTFLEWAKGVDAGKEGFVYIVDNHGHLAFHPRVLVNEEIIDYSTVPVVQDLLKQGNGFETVWDPLEKEEQLAVYYAVPRYGWGVVITQPLQYVFAECYSNLRNLGIIYSAIVTVEAVLLLLLFLYYERGRKTQVKERALLSSIGDGVIATDAHGRIILMNTAAEQILGWKEEEWLGKSVFNKIFIIDQNGKEISEEHRPLRQAFVEKKMIKGVYMYERKDGTRHPAAITVAPVILDGQLVGLVDVFRDVSQQRAIDRAKTEFVSLASHQLRTPLSTSKWYSEMLLSGEMGKFTKKQLQYLEEIRIANVRMVELVNALLNVSRIELGAFAVEPEPVLLSDIANSVLDELASEIKKKKLHVGKVIPKNLPMISADPKLLRIVVENLLTNAIKYTPADGRVTIEMRKREKDLLMRVSDTGFGIPDYQQSKIFSKLFRADNAREIDPAGSGLGLYIVKSIVETAGGSVWFKSEEGRGTDFYFTLPLSGMSAKAGAKYLSS
ncbi:MAG: ATP-binding protein, partial [bacterium]|nr:ATP-binding protein [bacterium]